MTFSEKLVKSYLYFGCLLDVALGITSIIIASKSKNVDRDLFPEDDQKNALDSFALVLYILGSVSIITGFLGFYGIIRKNKCLQVLFIILNIIYVLSFGALFGLSIYARKFIDNQMTDENCLKNDLGDANTTFIKFKEVWCNIGESPLFTCPCYISNFDQWTDEEITQIKKKKAISNIKLIGTERIQDCNFFIKELAKRKEKEIII